ncbi:hypothetical protein CRYUN_Cryun02cG0188500 [Craigia yunnanensis]
MGSQFNGFSNSFNGFKFDNGFILPNSNGYPKFEISNGVRSNDQSLDFSSIGVPFLPSLGLDNSSTSSFLSMDKEGDPFSPSDDSDFSDTVLKYISQVLLEEDMEEKPCMFHDSLALQAAEKSLYEVLGDSYPPRNQAPLCSDRSVGSPDNCSFGTFSDHSTYTGSSSCTSNSIDSRWNGDFGENNNKPSLLQTSIPENFVFQSTMNSGSQSSGRFQNNSADNGNGLAGSSVSELAIPNYFSQSELALHFKRGAEEASKFLPKGNQLTIDFESYALASELKQKATKMIVKVESDGKEYSPPRLTGKKNQEREDEDLEEGRNNKQSAVFGDESELSDMFDKVLICAERKGQSPTCTADKTLQNGPSKTLQQNEQTNGSSSGKARGKKQGKKKEVVDLSTRLILCAQAISADDTVTAKELIKQIRQHSSPIGDGSQRLAHCFVDALEARLAGTGTQIYTSLAAKRTSAADMLKAYQVFFSACPFMKMAICFANINILKVAEKATTLHIIDFGILYGFQWPSLIHGLANRPGGPPKLRITGIEFPRRGFRPAEGVLETGHRLARYCERYNVPFEYNAIAQKWETIRTEDLKINSNEVIAVNCLFRFRNLLDETVVLNSPRDTVLNLIRKINPDIFVHSVVNGSYSAPFFITRFREALFHFSALFDMCETNVPREDHMRSMLEQKFYGREIMNIIACEGTERVERPESYKQWHVRNLRAGFMQLPVDSELMKKVRVKVKECYHSDFMVNVDGRWMLQGWKGRIIYASSAWIPA